MTNTQEHDELELARIMREATRGLDVPAGRLAAGGLRRGRVALVRRRIGTGLTVVAVAAAIGVTYQVVPHGPSAPAGDAHPAAGGAPASAAPARTPRKLTTPAAALQRVLDALPANSGKVTDAHAEALGEGETGFRISLHLDGALVSFYVDDPNNRRREAGLSDLGPGSECLNSHPMPAGCQRLADGSWQENFSRPTGGFGVPADFVENDAWYWTADGWRVYSAAYNATAEKTGTKTGAVPPLTVAQLSAIAQGDAWFAGAAG